jgi:hypothetical protein
MYEVGFYEALKLSSYSKQRAYQLFKDPRTKEYLLSYFQDEVGKLNLTYSDILKERLALARDPDTPAKVREDILKDIGEIIKASEDVNSETTDIKRLPFLKPAQQLKQAETVEAKEVKTEST